MLAREQPRAKAAAAVLPLRGRLALGPVAGPLAHDRVQARDDARMVTGRSGRAAGRRTRRRRAPSTARTVALHGAPVSSDISPMTAPLLHAESMTWSWPFESRRSTTSSSPSASTNSERALSRPCDDEPLGRPERHRPRGPRQRVALDRAELAEQRRGGEQPGQLAAAGGTPRAARRRRPALGAVAVVALQQRDARRLVDVRLEQAHLRAARTRARCGPSARAACAQSATSFIDARYWLQADANSPS